MHKKKAFWIILLITIIIASGGYYYYSTQMAPENSAAAQEPEMQTVVVRRGELIVFASGAGSVVPTNEIGLGFDESGTLIELIVQVGNIVRAGDVLARLQTANSSEEIAASISDSELDVIRAQQTIDELYANAEIARTEALNDISVYAQEVRDGQYQLENYTVPIYLQGLDTIEALDLMKNQLDKASAEFEPYRYYSVDNDLRQDRLDALNNAQSQYDAAVKRLNYEYELAVAQANLDKARREYEKYNDGPAIDELTLAEAELANAQAKLLLAQEAQAVIELIAPMDGTVMTIDASVGEAVGTSTILTLADLEDTMLEVYLDETDLDKAAVGYEAEVVFDALPDQTFRGEVVSISPSLETVSNVQAVKTIVLLDREDLDHEISLPVGLNASVDIIAGQTENALLVPVEALRELSPGEYAVFVVENGEPKLRIVDIGLIDITYAEILSGLDAGEIVSTGIVQAE